MLPDCYGEIQKNLKENPKTWLVTGAAGYIGSHLVEKLLRLDQVVIGVDNFATGFRQNLETVRHNVGPRRWHNLRFEEGDITDGFMCARAARGADHILHQAALGSVPRSIANPRATNMANIHGFLNVLEAAREEGTTFVYAASSATYGDHPALPRREHIIGNPLSPYAVTKYVNELYAAVYNRAFGFKSIGLRYFNVFGELQSPDGAYAAVIPKWVSALLNSRPVQVNGDGKTTRDFCYVDNVVQANILAACAPESAKGEVYNVAGNARTSLNDLLKKIDTALKKRGIRSRSKISYGPFRQGDVAHSLADISKATAGIGYVPTHSFEQGIEAVIDWHMADAAQARSA